MNIGNLKMFYTVVDEGSISEAARKNYVSQPAVTKQIRQLENHYDVALFNRTGGKLILTEAGETLYPYAKEMVECLNNSEEAVHSLVEDYESNLQIGASLTIGEYLLPGVLGHFQKEKDNINFNLSIGSTPYIIDMLDDYQIDMALVEGIVESDKFQVANYAKDELILIIPYDHQWANKESIPIGELVTEKMIWREQDAGARKIIENVFNQHDVLDKIKSQMELGSTQAIKSAVEAHLGVGIVPKLSVIRELESGVFKHLPIQDINIKRDLWIVKRKSRFPKESVRAFTSFLKNLDLKDYLS